MRNLKDESIKDFLLCCLERSSNPNKPLIKSIIENQLEAERNKDGLVTRVKVTGFNTQSKGYLKFRNFWNHELFFTSLTCKFREFLSIHIDEIEKERIFRIEFENPEMQLTSKCFENNGWQDFLLNLKKEFPNQYNLMVNQHEMFLRSDFMGILQGLSFRNVLDYETIEFLRAILHSQQFVDLQRRCIPLSKVYPLGMFEGISTYFSPYGENFPPEQILGLFFDGKRVSISDYYQIVQEIDYLDFWSNCKYVFIHGREEYKVKISEGKPVGLDRIALSPQLTM